MADSARKKSTTTPRKPRAPRPATVSIPPGTDIGKIIADQVAAAMAEQKREADAQQKPLFDSLAQIQATLFSRPAVQPAADVDAAQTVARSRGTIVTAASSVAAAVQSAAFAAFNYRAFLAAAKPYIEVIKSNCDRFGYPELDAFVQIAHDSGFNALAESNAGALGIGQIMPDRAADWKIDPLDPDASIRSLIVHMAQYRDKYAKMLALGTMQGPSDPVERSFRALDLALAAYDSSPEAVDAAGGVPQASFGYVSMIGGTVRAILSSSGNRAQWIEDVNALHRA